MVFTLMLKVAFPWASRMDASSYSRWRSGFSTTVFPVFVGQVEGEVYGFSILDKVYPHLHETLTDAQKHGDLVLLRKGWYLL